MNIAFFELEDWEQDFFSQHFPNAQYSSMPLDLQNVNQYTQTDILCTFIYSQITEEIIRSMPNLRCIATQSTGFDHIDLKAAQQRNILVSNVPEYGTRTVAEHTFALILALTKKLYVSINQSKQFDFSHNRIRTINLYQRTLGIIGLGKIGKEVVKIAHGFGMNVLIYTRTHDEAFAKEWGIRYAELNEVLENSDIVTLHIPYSKDTHHILNKENLNRCKKGAYIVNTSRGGLIETEALIQALENGTLAGAGLDVLEEEKNLTEELDILKTSLPERIDFKTLTMDHVLIHHPKVVVTPHNAFNSEEALQKILNTTVDNIKAFIEGHPINLVS